jgi:hypothetical protein
MVYAALRVNQIKMAAMMKLTIPGKRAIRAKAMACNTYE